MLSVLRMLAKPFMELLETLFGVGLIGCISVLILSFWDDVQTILGRH